MSDSKSIKVLHIIPGLGLGGAPRGVLELMAEQARHDRVQPHLCILNGDKSFVETAALPRDTRILNYGGRLGRIRDTRACINGLVEHARELHIDVLHTHLWLADVVGALAARRLRRKHVCHLRDTRPWLTSSGLKPFVRRVLYKYVLSRSSARCIAVSKAVKSYTCKALRWSDDRVDVVLNGINLSAFAGEVTTARRDVHAPIVVGAAGRLVPEKGFAYLVEGVAELKERGVVCRLRLAGEGSLGEELRGLCEKLNVVSEVEFCGAVRDMPSFYQSLDVFSVPSIAGEGLPRGLMEAMASGVAVVATDHAGAPEAFDDGVHGFLVPVADHHAMARALEKLIASPELLSGLRKPCRDHARQSFNIERVANQVEEVYRNVLPGEWG